MTISYVRGDLFTSQAQTLAHGVNVAGRMRAGIADEFRLRFPEMYQEYRRLCHRRELLPGGVFLGKASEPWVLNLATQEDTKGARLEFVRESLLWLAANHEAEGIVSVAMPRIGAGLGALEWEDVRGVLEEILGPCDLPVTVCEYAGADGEGVVEAEEAGSEEERRGRPIHEGSRWDDVWGWAGGEGRDLLGERLVEVRDTLARA